ncbi:MAG: DUF1634 domain-containing protein [Bacillota bacterium]
MSNENTKGAAERKRVDVDLNHILHYVLLIGVMVSIGVMLLGLVLLAFNPGAASHQTGPIVATVGAAFHGNPMAIITVGILLLMATPAVRVVTCLIGFLAERDWVYTAVAVAVALVLTFSIFIAAE